jgi:hypothetical protein
MREYHILNLGAGVQSTTLYLMSHRGDELELVPKFDYAIFADTQEEPKAVYDHLAWLKQLGGPEIIEVTRGSLGEHLLNGISGSGHRFASIPAYTIQSGEKREGQTQRQCTKEYKTDMVERVIRQQILGMKPRQRIPDGVIVHQYLGLSYDEPKRVARVKGRYAGNANPTGLLNGFDESPRVERRPLRWGQPHFPLFDMEWTREDCIAYLKELGVDAPRSACVFCPYHSNEEWRRLRDEDPTGWARAVQIDNSLRVPGVVVNRGLSGKLYLHRSCKPLVEAVIDNNENKMELYQLKSSECEGMCGL